MRDRSRDQHDVAWPVAQNPVSDVNVAILRVLNIGFHWAHPSGQRYSEEARR